MKLKLSTDIKYRLNNYTTYSWFIRVCQSLLNVLITVEILCYLNYRI